MSDVAAEAPARGSKRALMIEMEMALWPGVQRTFDVLKAVVAKRGVELDTVGFTRYFLGRPIRRGYRALLVAADKDGDLDAMMEETREALPAALSDTTGLTALSKLLAFGGEEDIELCVVARCDNEQAAVMLQAMGADPESTVVVRTDADTTCTTSADVWKRALRETACPARMSVAVVCSAGSAKSALAAGVRVAAVTAELTRQGDFGGSDVVVDDLGEASIETISELIRRA